MAVTWRLHLLICLLSTPTSPSIRTYFDFYCYLDFYSYLNFSSYLLFTLNSITTFKVIPQWGLSSTCNPFASSLSLHDFLHIWNKVNTYIWCHHPLINFLSSWCWVVQQRSAVASDPINPILLTYTTSCTHLGSVWLLALTTLQCRQTPHLHLHAWTTWLLAHWSHFGWGSWLQQPFYMFPIQFMFPLIIHVPYPILQIQSRNILANHTNNAVIVEVQCAAQLVVI